MAESPSALPVPCQEERANDGKNRIDLEKKFICLRTHDDSQNTLTHQERVVLQFLGDVPEQPLQRGEAASEAVSAHLKLEIGQQEVTRFRLK